MSASVKVRRHRHPLEVQAIKMDTFQCAPLPIPEAAAPLPHCDEAYLAVHLLDHVLHKVELDSSDALLQTGKQKKKITRAEIWTIWGMGNTLEVGHLFKSQSVHTSMWRRIVIMQFESQSSPSAPNLGPLHADALPQISQSCSVHCSIHCSIADPLGQEYSFVVKKTNQHHLLAAHWVACNLQTICAWFGPHHVLNFGQRVVHIEPTFINSYYIPEPTWPLTVLQKSCSKGNSCRLLDIIQVMWNQLAGALSQLEILLQN